MRARLSTVVYEPPQITAEANTLKKKRCINGKSCVLIHSCESLENTLFAHFRFPNSNQGITKKFFANKKYLRFCVCMCVVESKRSVVFYPQSFERLRCSNRQLPKEKLKVAQKKKNQRKSCAERTLSKQKIVQ